NAWATSFTRARASPLDTRALAFVIGSADSWASSRHHCERRLAESKFAASIRRRTSAVTALIRGPVISRCCFQWVRSSGVSTWQSSSTSSSRLGTLLTFFVIDYVYRWNTQHPVG